MQSRNQSGVPGSGSGGEESMMNEHVLLSFLGWCTVINLGLLILASIALTLFKRPIMNIHASLFELPYHELERLYIQYLGNYKIAILVFNLVPYLALRIVS